MVFFITVLRAIAACIITNAHYTGIYPTDLIANGGLIGDVIFFAVSGYCLYNPGFSFFKWYGKRIYRVFIPTWVITILFLIIGYFSFSEKFWFHYFIYPTDYHFVGSIIVLYIPYFFIVKYDVLKRNIPIIMGIIALFMFLIYIIFYDKSYYHIDTVREPFIRFLFMESMLLGAYFKNKDETFRDNFSYKWCLFMFLTFIAYFASKMYFLTSSSFLKLQILNQILIFSFLYCLFRVFSGLDAKLLKFPLQIKKAITFIANITLEIYLVQYFLIDALRPIFRFPINWIVLTLSILISAVTLHYICEVIFKLLGKFSANVKKA